MSGAVTPNENFIFFLRLDADLPESFFYISTYLSKFNISLIPVSIQDYMSFGKSERVHTIVLVNDLKSFAYYKRIRELYLDFSLKSGRTFLYEISSFGPIQIANKLRYQNTYHHFPLPDKTEQITRSIAKRYYDQKKSIAIWPGGRRAKLPLMV